jgi:hypothetical protein
MGGSYAGGQENFHPVRPPESPCCASSIAPGCSSPRPFVALLLLRVENPIPSRATGVEWRDDTDRCHHGPSAALLLLRVENPIPSRATGVEWRDDTNRCHHVRLSASGIRRMICRTEPSPYTAYPDAYEGPPRPPTTSQTPARSRRASPGKRRPGLKPGPMRRRPQRHAPHRSGIPHAPC